jgi:hypothetical protein
MAQYLLGVHTGGERGQQPPPEEMEVMAERIAEVESEMRAGNTWLFSGRLHGPEAATVVRTVSGRRVTTDGPYAESKEHLGGFYVIEAADLDEALHWAARTSEAIGMPIEVRPFVDIAR